MKVRCRRCHGRGRVRKLVADAVEYVACPLCGGKRFVQRKPIAPQHNTMHSVGEAK